MSKTVLHGYAPNSVNAAWKAREPFNANGTLVGIKGPYFGWLGRLPGEWSDVFTKDCARMIYCVFSYSTPIAWVLEDGTEVKPPVKYSVTTSKHQGRLY